MVADTNVFSPLTVTPSPDMLALKLQQVAARTVPTSGESRLLRKAREQTDNGDRGKPVGGDSAKVSHKLISHSSISHMEINGRALSCSVRIISRQRRTEWEMKGPSLLWRWQHPREPSPPPVMSLLPLIPPS